MKQLTSLLILISFSLQAQQTERFKNLVKDLEKGLVKTDTTYYGNEKVKYLSENTTYIFEGNEYNIRTGEEILYYRNGVIARISTKDEYGNFLQEQFYSKSGKLTEEWITTEIDNRAKNLEEYIKNRTSGEFSLGDIKKTINYYNYSKKTKKRFLFKQEYIEYINGILKETRNLIDQNGKIKKTKILKPREPKNVY